MDIDRDGVVWTVLASGHFASFDRRKCKGPLDGPTAIGQHCPEGWTLYRTPGPSFKDAPQYGSADTNYYNWVDQFDTFGMGKNIPIATGNDTDSLAALDPKTGSSLSCAFPIRWASSRRASMAESMILKPAERQRALVDVCDSRTLAYGRWQGDDKQGCKVPASS